MKIVRNEVKDGVFWEDNEAGVGWAFLGQEEVEEDGEEISESEGFEPDESDEDSAGTSLILILKLN